MKTGKAIKLVGTITVIGVVLFMGMNIFTLSQGNEAPWQTAQGRACIDAWMQDTVARLNSTDLGEGYNSSKPWRFNQYGLLLGRTSYSNYKPDFFHNYENVQHLVWATYNRNSYPGVWTGSLGFLNRANIQSCQDYVRNCLGSGEGSGGGGGGGGGGGQTQQGILGQVVYLQSINYPDRYIRHANYLGELTGIPDQRSAQDASFKIVQGLADSRLISFESTNFPGYFLRHQGFRIKLHRPDGSDLFRKDSTFKIVQGLSNNQWVSFESINYPGRYIRHRNFHLYLEGGNTDLFRKDVTYKIVPVR